jgi:hypothetical protein
MSEPIKPKMTLEEWQRINFDQRERERLGVTEPIKTRYTWLIEYATPSDAPAAHAHMQALGGEVVAVQFSDALGELSRAEAEVERLRAELARLTKPPSPPPLWGKGCPVCGMFSQPGVYGVVCARGDCPTRVTCGVTK